jgi:hypothetical protein
LTHPGLEIGHLRGDLALADGKPLVGSQPVERPFGVEDRIDPPDGLHR